MLKKRIFAIAATAVIVTGLNQVQAAVSWDVSVASGANARFGWTGGENNTDRFADPTVDVSGFLFDDPDNFKATPAVSSVTDFARVTIDTALALGGPAAPLDTITIQEWGTFSGDLANIGLQADFSAFRFAPLPPAVTGSLSLPNDASIFDTEEGTWYTERTLTLSELPVWNLPFTKFQLTVTNTVQVNAGAPVGTFIEKQGMRIIIPEPGTISLLAIGIIPLLRRRK